MPTEQYLAAGETKRMKCAQPNQGSNSQRKKGPSGPNCRSDTNGITLTTVLAMRQFNAPKTHLPVPEPSLKADPVQSRPTRGYTALGV